jgi:hypothetical protein
MINQIIGNNERTSRIDTDLWKKLNEKYSGIENKTEEDNSKEEPITQIPKNNSIEQKVTYHSITGKPLITLIPLTTTVVNTKTQKEYDNLMQIYEAGQWKEYDYNTPTEYNTWKRYGIETNIDAKNLFKNFSSHRISVAKWNKLSLEEFCIKQNITQEIITKLNKYYEIHYPNRKSKG